MGEIADELYDRGLEEEYLYDKEMEYLLNQNDDILKKYSKESKIPIIISIRKFAKLSEKQRIVLARWIIENSDEDYIEE